MLLHPFFLKLLRNLNTLVNDRANLLLHPGCTGFIHCPIFVDNGLKTVYVLVHIVGSSKRRDHALLLAELKHGIDVVSIKLRNYLIERV